jgi:hypothetical protein
MSIVWREYLMNEMSQHQFWEKAYLASFNRLDAASAIAEANKALDLCNKRWEKETLMPDVRPRHSFPLGHYVDG